MAGDKASASRDIWQQDRAAYLFLLPWFIGFVCFTAGPALISLYLSFTKFDLLTAPTWNGVDNYVYMFGRDKLFWQSLKVTFSYVAMEVPLKLIMALAIATVLDKGISGAGFYRAVFYVPSLLGGSAAIAILWRNLFERDGLVNNMLFSLFGVHGPSWISNPDTSIYTLVLLAVWQFGSPMIIFLAGLRQIPREIYEAASIDGAGKVTQYFKITLPLLAPVIFFNLVLQIIEAFKVFTPAFIIGGTEGAPGQSTLFYTLYLYSEGFAHFRMGYAAALAWVLLIIIGFFTALSFLSSKYWVHYEDGDR